MRRRTFLITAGASLAATGLVSTASASSEDAIATSFFDSLREAEEHEPDQLLVACADNLCVDEQIADKLTEQIIEKADRIDQHLWRVRFRVRIFHANNIITALDTSMVNDLETGTRDATRIVPLVTHR